MKLYIVRNKEGKFFRNIGYMGSGGNWREKMEDAKFYTKLGQAKSRVTFFFKNYPQFGCPEILEFDLMVEKAIIIDMEELTAKAIKKANARKEKERLNYINLEIKRLEDSRNREIERLERLEQERKHYFLNNG